MPTKNTFSILKNIQNIQQDLLSENIAAAHAVI